ncbi:unnamed protein product [Cuscuta epithymum]|uniref:Uncharacterized protein n=1 Tax=Cuscuta epithymum TaxID=186058 RepID=A0AAV0DGJ5_9ASTE|nr:unnamed protein product [Cuscuta epithymum]
MEKAELISSCLVGAAAMEEVDGGIPRIHQIELTPWDLKSMLLDYIQKGLIFPSPKSSSSFIDHLRASLSSTLHFFPPLAGRLSVAKNDDGTTSVFINCNNQGAEFAVANAAGVTLAQILEPTIVPRIVHSLFPFNGLSNIDGVSNPLLGVQVTQLADGYFIGCAMNHSVADASSFWHFFNSWAEISRGFRKPSIPPVLHPWFPENMKSTGPLRLRLDLDKEKKLSLSFKPQPFQERVFHFSQESIAKLKLEANSEMGFSTKDSKISSLQSYVAHLWRAITRSRRVNAAEEVFIYVPIGTRWRMDPPLPEGYWGNAIYSKMVRVKAGDLLERGFGWAAWQIHQVVAGQKHEEAVEFYENWVRSPAVARKETLFCTNFLGIASSPRNDVYGTDFGWGKSVAVRCGMDNKADGKFSLFPGVEEGSVDIEVCLLPQTLLALGNDEEFMAFVTT